MAKTGSLKLGGQVVDLTNTDRVMFPDVGVTKRDVIDYYKDVADLMIHEIADRALTMERYTKSIAEGGFVMKHAQKHYPEWIPRAELGEKTVVEYPVCNSQAALVYFANQGGVAFHIWASQIETPNHPNEIVFDLDPPDISAFPLVRQTAHVLKDLLEELNLPTYVKTSGSKGLHVVVPTDAKATYEKVRELVSLIAKLLIERYPDLVTLEFHKKDRKGRLYFDTGRNIMGATFVAPYSLRGRPGAPISAPLAWPEIDEPDFQPNGIRLRDWNARRDAVGDAWYGWRKKPGSVAKAIKKLQSIVAG
ncbi:MAG TPA: non-homologous end-joining DNA ligase [Kofleriaceae bacterium]